MTIDSEERLPEPVEPQPAGSGGAPPPAVAPDTPPRPRASTAAMVLAVLAVCYTLWATQGLILPVLLAMFFALIGNPIIRVLQHLRIPRFVGALVVLLGGLALVVLLGRQLVQPAGEWISEAPREMRSLAPKLQKLIRPVQEANKAAENIARVAGGESTAKPVQVVKTEVNDPYKSLTATPMLVASVLAVVLLTFFFMVYGQDLQRNAIALLPDRQKKMLTHDIVRTIETELSRYVMTITMINAGLALILSLVFWQLGLDPADALLWGAIGGLLNFAPYVGPVIGVVTLGVVGVVAFDAPLHMLSPALCYLGLQLLESEVVTPIILGKRWSISPLIVLLWLLFCGWLWSIPGVLLAVPMLVSFKIVAERIESLNGWAKVIA